MRSFQESNLIVFWRWLLLVDIVLLSYSQLLSSAAEIKIRLESEENNEFENFPSQLNRQQRRYDEDSGYRHIQINLEDTKESFNQYNKNHENIQIHEEDRLIKNRIPIPSRSQEETKTYPTSTYYLYPSSNYNRGLVPQLWPNYTAPTETPAENVSCNTARFECSKRAGCQMALTSYAMYCTTLVPDLNGRKRKRRPRGRRKFANGQHDELPTKNVCTNHCRHSLIALMSTHEGKRMMKCNCEGDSFCERSKASVAPCQNEVERATKPDAIVSCTSAQWICAADPECAEALEWYKRLCRPMFKGRKCTKKCQNTIETLRSLSKRQNAAKKLETCYCDGTEDFKCDKIKSNMDALCFKQNEEDIMSNEIEVDRFQSQKSSSSSLKQKIEQFLIMIVVFVQLFVAYVSASIQVMVSSFEIEQ